jgi:hypothetical protein
MYRPVVMKGRSALSDGTEKAGRTELPNGEKAVSLKDFYTYSDMLTRMILGRRSENFKGSPEILRVDLRHGLTGFSFEGLAVLPCFASSERAASIVVQPNLSARAHAVRRAGPAYQSFPKIRL